MSRHIDADELIEFFDSYPDHIEFDVEDIKSIINEQDAADVVEADKAQKEIDYWHDKAQSYEQTILKLSLNKADVVEVVRCKDCKYLDKGENDSESWCECTAHFGKYFAVDENGFCSYGERAEQ